MNDRRRTRGLGRLTRLLDTQFRIPGTSIRIGIDPLLGLIPVGGDAISLGISGYIVWRAWRLGLPKRKIVKMLWNLGLDALLGSLPVVGDVFDFFFRANVKNLKIIRAHQEVLHGKKETRSHTRATRSRPLNLGLLD